MHNINHKVPIRVLMESSLKKSSIQGEFIFDCAVDSVNKNNKTWKLLVVKKRNAFFIVISNQIEIDDSNVATVIPKAFLHSYPFCSVNDTYGWIYTSSLSTPFSEFEKHEFFKRNLKEYARNFLLADKTFQKIIPQYFSEPLSVNGENKAKSTVSFHKSSEQFIVKDPKKTAPFSDDFFADKGVPHDPIFQIIKQNLAGLEMATGANKEIVSKVANGMSKPLITFPPVQAIEHLYVEFPNFSSVITKVRRRLLLASRTKDRIGFKFSRPILMVGPPGIGKTKFAAALSKSLNLPLRSIDMSIQTASFVLTGSSSQWSESKQGLIADELILRSPVANPIFILNELDKVEMSSRSPLAALLGLFDDTANEFVDEFVGCDFPINASYINYLLTANSIHNLSDPLLTRVDIEWIPSPTTEQKYVIGQSIYKELMMAPWGSSFSPTLCDAVLKILAREENPREMYSCLDNAIGVAAESGATALLPEHFLKTEKKKIKLGF